jgi:hypothetical protein
MPRYRGEGGEGLIIFIFKSQDPSLRYGQKDQICYFNRGIVDGNTCDRATWM